METIVCSNTINWQPDELVDIGDGCHCGITTDDHCYIILLPSGTEQWKPTPWIPKQVAKRIGELATDHYKV